MQFKTVTCAGFSGGGQQQKQFAVVCWGLTSQTTQAQVYTAKRKQCAASPLLRKAQRPI
jgi:hypothetical protein